jgi:hypothetical protein
MTTDELDSGELRIINVKLAENQKQLHIAEENCDEEKIKLYTNNIKHYQKQLNKLEK